LDLVQLSSFAERLPRQLSGGQQQRVALARALVFDPALLLLDEPLSALDKKLRAELQEELKSLHRRVGRTFINVTHDQEEALSLSDRIAILNHGRLIQHGPAAFLYENPRTRFVADFLGKSNFIRADVVRHDDQHVILRAGNTELRQHAALFPEGAASILLSLRPERIRLLKVGETAENEITAQIRSWSYLGSGFSIIAGIPEFGDIRVNAPANHPSDMLRDGASIRLGWDADAAKPVLEDE
jgi:putative spermidine/putrescine transport system ATP-binding protein